MAMLLAACNEKVSPELQEGSTVTTPTDTTVPVPPTEYYFNIENTSAQLLNYKLHKTGTGNANVNCEVKNTTGLSSDNFRANPTANDITCYLEAEELSLFHGGFNVKMNASKNTCDFVGYMPYGFYNRIPGDSTSTLVQTVCTNDTTNSGHVRQAAAAAGLEIRTADPYVSDPADPITSYYLGCGEFATEDNGRFPISSRLKFNAESDADLCRFNYKDGGMEKCDVGTITVKTLLVTYTPPNDAGTGDVLKQQLVTRTVRCGGEVSNCVKGPTKELGAGTRTLEITQGEINKPISLEYKYAGRGNGDTTRSNIHLANYRRSLANPNIDFNTSVGLTAGYKNAWNSAAYGKRFDPRLMDSYAANVRLDFTNPIVEDDDAIDEAVRNNMWFAKPLAAEPYIGLAERVNPFYSFYCFDTAFDIKARIRLVVRDWDRIFPQSSDLEYLSDLFLGVNSKQDNPNYVELNEDLDIPIPFNDLNDWDDRFGMERTTGVLAPGLTVWRPTPTAFYADGWFNPAIFPNFVEIK